MKKLITLTSSLLCAAALIAGSTDFALDMKFKNAEPALSSKQKEVFKSFMGNSYTNAAAIAATKVQAKAQAQLPPGIKIESVLSEDFSKWTEGKVGEPAAEYVTDEFAATAMDYPGEWTLWHINQAGGTAFCNFERTDEDDPGYVKTPAIDVSGGQGVYRITCRAMNANPNAQDQLLQGFFLDETVSQIRFASAQPLVYNEWTECEWIGTGGLKELSCMLFGWKGLVYIDWIKVDQLIYPLDSPADVNAFLSNATKIDVTWGKVDGATGYKVELVDDEGNTLASEETGDTDATTLSARVDGETTYRVYVTALNGENYSYPGGWFGEFEAGEVGAATALAATDITENGFTANWTAADFAANYRILTRYTHTAETDGEEYVLLDEYFKNVPAEANEYNPLQFIPLMGMGGFDMYMSRHGWDTDAAVMMNMGGVMPGLILMNMYASAGLKGQLISPVGDFSVGNGTVYLKGMGLTGADDAIITFGFVDSTGEMYASTEFELSTEGDMIDAELTGGKADSRLVMYISDAAGEEMAFFPNLNMTMKLNAGETMSFTYDTYVADGEDTSMKIETPFAQNDKYEYAVQGYFSKDNLGKISDFVTVTRGTVSIDSAIASGASVSVDGNAVTVVNPGCEAVAIYSVDGCKKYDGASESVSVALEKGIYVVCVGDRTFKVAL